MADRYTGRHIFHARHTAWAQRKRSPQPSRLSLLPAAAALTIMGILIGGTGAAIQVGAIGSSSNVDVASNYNPADYIPADRAAQSETTNRFQARTGPTAVALPAPPVAKVTSTGNCKASYYGSAQRTADGETFNASALTAASKTLPFNTMVRVTNPANNKSVLVRINDRGPYVSGRCLSLSKSAFAAIASLGQGVIGVRFEVLAPSPA